MRGSGSSGGWLVGTSHPCCPVSPYRRYAREFGVQHVVHDAEMVDAFRFEPRLAYMTSIWGRFTKLWSS